MDDLRQILIVILMIIFIIIVIINLFYGKSDATDCEMCKGNDVLHSRCETNTCGENMSCHPSIKRCTLNTGSVCSENVDCYSGECCNGLCK